MSYQVIARKYRPQRFSDVVGQEHVTRTLANAIEQNRIAHAYLFVGPRGTGKTTIARIFAKCLNCTGGPKTDFPDDDPRAREIAEGRSLDVLEIDGASNRGIEEIRELRETVKYSPANGQFKIYIIDEVHMLTKEAFNALLKTLEEPPAHVKFMFATTEPEKVLPTILSRCQRFDLRRIPVRLMVDHLAKIARLEKIEIDAGALEAVARGAEGGLRDAESTLDQLISFCGTRIVEEDVLSMFGLAARSQILKLAGCILRSDSPAALAEFNDLVQNGKDLGRLLSDLLQHFRNLLLFQISGGDTRLLDLPEADLGQLKAESGKVSTEAITRIMEILSNSESRLRDAASKRIFFEITLVRSAEASRAVSIDSLLQQIQQLREEQSAGGSGSPPPNTSRGAAEPAPADTVSPASKTPPRSASQTVAATRPAEQAPAPIATAVAAAGRTEDLNALWHRLLESVGRVSAFIRTYLLEAHPVGFQGHVFVIGFDPEFADHLSLVDNSKTHTILQTKLAELGHRCQIKFVKADAPEHWSRPVVEEAPAAAAVSPTPAAPAAGAISAGGDRKPAALATATAVEKPQPKPFDPAQFKNDPLIQKALEVFKGQIVEVRS